MISELTVKTSQWTSRLVIVNIHSFHQANFWQATMFKDMLLVLGYRRDVMATEEGRNPNLWIQSSLRHESSINWKTYAGYPSSIFACQE
jgi:hypothetical protein